MRKKISLIDLFAALKDGEVAFNIYQYDMDSEPYWNCVTDPGMQANVGRGIRAYVPGSDLWLILRENGVILEEVSTGNAIDSGWRGYLSFE